MRLTRPFVAVIVLFVAIRVDAQCGLQAPAPERLIVPNYCARGALSDLGGKVTAVVTVSSDGTVSEVKIKKTSGTLLDDAVIVALQRWVFVPAKKCGKVVPAQITIPIVFDAESHEVTVDLTHYFDE